MHNLCQAETLPLQFVSINDKGKIGQVIRNWPRMDQARISVVTDGSRILGLGDLGINGIVYLLPGGNCLANIVGSKACLFLSANSASMLPVQGR